MADHKDSGPIKRPLIGEANANWLSRLYFYWLSPLIELGHKRPLVETDFPELAPEEHTGQLTEQFEAAWRAELETSQPSVGRALKNAFGFMFFVGGVFKIIADGFTLLSPILIEWFITFVVDRNNAANKPALWVGYVLAVAILLNQILTSALLNMCMYQAQLFGFRVRTVLLSSIFRKTLRLSPGAKAEMDTGKTLNLMSTDTGKIDMFLQFFHLGWSALPTIIVLIGLLWRNLGPSSLAGVGAILITGPIQGSIMRKGTILRMQAMVHTDKRVKLMNEILQGIKILKVYAWEDSFAAKINAVRKSEMDIVKGIFYIRSFNGVIMMVGPVFMQLVCFLTYSLAGNSFTPQTIFSSIVLFNILRMPLLMLPLVLAFQMDARVSLDRIQSYLTSRELEGQPTLLPDQAFAIKVQEGNFSWEVNLQALEAKKKAEAAKARRGGPPGMGGGPPPPSSTSPATRQQPSASTANAIEMTAPVDPKNLPSRLSNVSCVIPRGSLTAVVGKVGSGKSSFLSAILGEMKKLNGEVVISGSVSYCPQQAWIQNATLRNNILFGLPYDKQRYEQAIRVCALERDLEVLPDGDQTEIGEKGINLSGGQKQRINIARAVYKDTDIILLDDPLSAVDSHVSKELFDNCICGALRTKTRILVTHQLQYMRQCDLIIVLRDGEIAEQGTFAQLMSDNSMFTRLMQEHGGESKDKKEGEEEDEKNKDSKSAVDEKKVGKTLAAINSLAPGNPDGNSTAIVKKDAPKKLMTVEDRATGSIPAEVYSFWVETMGGWRVFAPVLLLTAASIFFRIAADYWLSFWTTDDLKQSNNYYMVGFFILGVLQAIWSAIMGYAWAKAGYYSAVQIHERSFRTVLRAPMSFFDTTPIGRVINRFSKDQDTIDSLLFDSVRLFCILFLSIIFTLVTIIRVTPMFAIGLVPTTVFYYYTQSLYRSTSREVKRLEAVSRSPLTSQFAETLNGLSSIRAFREQSRFMDVNRMKIDDNNRIYYIQQAALRWVGVRLEIAGAFIIFFCALFVVVTVDSINPGLAALAVAYSQSVTSSFTFMVRQAAEAEAHMASVERAKHYTDSIPQERPAIEPDNRPPKTWPSRGTVAFNNYSMRYREGLPLVLDNINIVFKGGEKIGVVGRTGSGKSSMLVALYRLAEPATADSVIVLDDVDITKIGLSDLRSNLSIIPQDPVLYSGTVRSNLDPFGLATDEKIWAALEQSHLRGAIERLDQKLDAPVTENGENFSVGQRCQMCLARALLRRAKVLCLDEATASVDLETDAAIQQSIRTYFNNCTIITIAHRLNTIVDYDKVLVMKDGKVAEYDSPANLLRNPRSIFSAMVDDTGPTNAALLRSLAFNSQESKTLSIIL